MYNSLAFKMNSLKTNLYSESCHCSCYLFQNIYKMSPCFRCGCRGGAPLSSVLSSLFSSPAVSPTTLHYLNARKVGIAFLLTPTLAIYQSPPPGFCLSPSLFSDSSISSVTASSATVTSIAFTFAWTIHQWLKNLFNAILIPEYLDDAFLAKHRKVFCALIGW